MSSAATLPPSRRALPPLPLGPAGPSHPATLCGPRRAAVVAGRADDAARRKGVRRGRERGCWLYVSEAQLLEAGWTRDDPPPYSRVWVDPKRPRLVINLYREK